MVRSGHGARTRPARSLDGWAPPPGAVTGHRRTGPRPPRTTVLLSDWLDQRAARKGGRRAALRPDALVLDLDGLAGRYRDGTVVRAAGVSARRVLGRRTALAAVVLLASTLLLWRTHDRVVEVFDLLQVAGWGLAAVAGRRTSTELAPDRLVVRRGPWTTRVVGWRQVPGVRVRDRWGATSAAVLADGERLVLPGLPDDVAERLDAVLAAAHDRPAGVEPDARAAVAQPYRTRWAAPAAPVSPRFVRSTAPRPEAPARPPAGDADGFDWEGPFRRTRPR